MVFLPPLPPSTPLDDPLTKPYGDSQPFATTEIPTADNPCTRSASLFFHPQQIGTTSLSLSLFLPLKTPRLLCQVRSPTTRSTTLPLHILYRVAAILACQLCGVAGDAAMDLLFYIDASF